MKKTLILVLAILMVSGFVWGQTVPGPPSITITSLLGGMPFEPRTPSIEARFSGGIFRGDVDNFIDVNEYNPDIGTFLFTGTNFGITRGVTPGSPNFPVSFGLGKTLNSSYLGIYYHGTLVDSEGTYYDSSKTDESSGDWQNNLAILLGTQNMGAFRLDLIVNTETGTRKSGSDTLAKRGLAPLLGLTWGGMHLEGMDPYIILGVKFPENYTWGNTSGQQVKLLSHMMFGLMAGITAKQENNSSFDASAFFLTSLGSSYKGNNSSGLVGFNTVSNLNVKYGGAYAVGLQGNYTRTLDFNRVSAGFSPFAGITFGSDDTAKASGDYSTSTKSREMFFVNTGINFGIELKATEKISLYTGANLRLFNWMFSYRSGNSRYYQFQGIGWNDNTDAYYSNFGIGLKFVPMENFTIRAGLRSRLTSYNYAYIDLDNMKFDLTFDFKF